MRDNGVATRIDRLVEDLLGPDANGPVAPRLPRLRPRDRERLVAEAQKLSRMIRDDPREQRLLDELENIQADNADE